MTQYIDILLTKDGIFCVAPPWVIKEGDLICLLDAVTGREEIREVISVATDSTDGDHIEMLKKYIGYPLPKVISKYHKCEVEWNDSVQE